MHGLSRSSQRHPTYHAAICAIARDEDHYIIEWIAYHLAIGFDHIFIYDNMSKHHIVRLIDDRFRHQVTVIRWPTIVARDAQLEAYDNFLWSHGRDCEWVAVIDLDEMINLKKHRSIRAFLQQFDDATTVAINWRIFGSSGHTKRQNDFVMNCYRQASEIGFSHNQHVKSIYRIKYLNKIGHHNGYYSNYYKIFSPSRRTLPNEAAVAVSKLDFEIAQINHYFVKSNEEWEAKLQRGYADGTVRPPGTFEIFDRNEVLDESILTRYRRTRRLAHRLTPRRATVRGVRSSITSRLKSIGHIAFTGRGWTA